MKSHVKISLLVISLINLTSIILFPIKTEMKTTGIKPKKLDKRNLQIGISNNDKIIFCNINGGPGINLKIIRYSMLELEIYLLIFWAYFS